MKSAILNTCRTLFFVFGLASCNHLFYYPDAHFYVDPAQGHVRYENLVWENSENLKLQVLDMFAEGPEIGTILHLHGNAQNRSSHFQYSYWLTQSGYRVLVPDYRGYGLSEGVPSREGLVSDAKYFIERTCQTGQKPVFLFGQSLGGALAIPALAHLNDACVCGLIVESSFSSYRRIARQKLDSFWLSWAFQYPLSFLVSDNESPVDYVGKVHIPTLFIHGTADNTVPYAFGKELFDKSGSSDKELWTLPDAGHTPAFREMQSPYKQRLLDWLAKQSLHCKLSSS